ncbi:MAG: transposase [Bdellovibrionaceae bacterium]|nr:transposase [Pseudobdellovibrionaceae bacterium]
MPRPKAILQNEFPYHVSARCINKEWFHIPMENVWDIFCRQLTYISWVYDAKVHAFVLMNNHFHLLVSTPRSNLSEIMANFMKETSRQINGVTGRINQTYGSRHFRSIIASQHYYLHAYKYVYRNPVAAGITERCETYKFSSLNFLIGKTFVGFPVVEDNTLFSDIEGTLIWLNSNPDADDWITVGNAMRKSKFQIAKDKSTKRPHRLEFDML